MMMKRYLLTITLVVTFLSVAFTGTAAEEPMSILLLGTDSLGYELVTGDEEMSRADAIYVLKLFPDTGAIKLLSIERDYSVTLPGDLGQNKLGTSTYFGGPQMAMEAVNELLSLDIDLFAQIDLAQLVTAVDAIGGLSVEVSESEVENVNEFIGWLVLGGIADVQPVQTGVNHLNGYEFWAFVGTRNIAEDSIASNKARNDRQMRAVRAGLQRLNEVGFRGAMEVVDTLLPFVKTNLTMSDILTAVQIVQKSDPDTFMYLRTPSTSYAKKRVGLHQVIVPDSMAAERTVIASFLFK